jgi:hypothetical protein
MRSRHLGHVGARFAVIEPDISIGFTARIRACLYLANVDMLIAAERRNIRAHAFGIELPAMKWTGDFLPVEISKTERSTLVRADIAHCEDRAIGFAADQNQIAQEISRYGLAFLHMIAGQSEVPDVIHPTGAHKSWALYEFRFGRFCRQSQIRSWLWYHRWFHMILVFGFRSAKEVGHDTALTRVNRIS